MGNTSEHRCLEGFLIHEERKIGWELLVEHSTVVGPEEDTVPTEVRRTHTRWHSAALIPCWERKSFRWGESETNQSCGDGFCCYDASRSCTGCEPGCRSDFQTGCKWTCQQRIHCEFGFFRVCDGWMDGGYKMMMKKKRKKKEKKNK